MEQNESNLSFDQLPKAVGELLRLAALMKKRKQTLHHRLRMMTR